jgi:hypothetical protein
MNWKAIVAYGIAAVIVLFASGSLSIAYLENTKKMIESDSKAASKAAANATDK